MGSVRFEIAGIPIQIHGSFVLVLAILGFGSDPPWLLATWIGLGLVAVLVHELGHAFTLKAFGASPTVSLQGLGGLTAGADLGPGRGLAVSLAGPGAALVLMGLPAWIAWEAGVGQGTPGEDVLVQLLFVTVGWSVLNLIPILPLDGGNVVLHLLDLATGGRGEIPTRLLSLAIAGVGGWWGVQNDQFFLVILAAMFGMLNLSALGRVRVEAGDDAVRDAATLLLRRDAAGAIATLDAARRGRLAPATAAVATDLRAWAALAVGDADGARRFAAELPAGRQPSTRLQGALAMADGRTDEGITLLTWAYGNAPNDLERLLLVQYLAGTGLAATVGRELAADPGGRSDAARLVADLRRLGADEAAAGVQRTFVG